MASFFMASSIALPRKATALPPEVAADLPMLKVYSQLSYERRSDNPTPANGVTSKDVDLVATTGVWARIFLPDFKADESTKVPIVLHFHGGGFCIGSPASPDIHTFYANLAVHSHCIWVSVSYRLAPETPLPGAYNDAYEALVWLQSQASPQSDASGTEPWLAKYADFSKCFLAGDSAGGTIAHFLAAKAARKDWSPVAIRGLILIHPGFGKAKDETREEAALSDFYHRSSLPPGAEWGHPWSNPLNPASNLSKMDLPPVFVAVAELDGFREAAVEYYEVLKQNAPHKAGAKALKQKAQLFESAGVRHCFHLLEPETAPEKVVELENEIIKFINDYSS